MKKSILFLLIAFWLPSQLIAQSLSSSVVSCMGQHYASAQTQMSVTAGETVVEYYSSSIYSLGAGFQQSFEAFVKQLMVTLFLEGPFVVNAMLTTLNSSGLIPLAQPYNTAPWNHSGTEEAAYIPPNVVDWVLIELRDADSPGNATPATTLTGWPKAFFLKNDGSLVDLDGNMPNLGNLVFNDDLYVVVRHRNHLDVMSSGPLSLSGSTYTYDFTDAITKAHGGAAGYKQIGAGLYGMVAGRLGLSLWHHRNL